MILTLSWRSPTFISNKLGNSSEKDYYRKRVRQETQAAGRERIEAGGCRIPPDGACHRALDAKGELLPGYQSLYSYLVSYQPFPYGLSPFAVAYNYYRIAQHLQNDEHQQHLQISPSVIDSRPAISLENWASEEMDDGRKLELQLFEQQLPSDPQMLMDLQTAADPVSAMINRSVNIQHLIYCYDLAARLAMDASKAYEEHLANPDFNSNNFTYEWHSDHNISLAHLAAADGDYIQAVVSGGAKQRQLLEKARKDYQQTIRDCRIAMFKWFTPDDVLAKLDAKKMDVSGYSNEKLGAMSDELHHLLAMRAPGVENGQNDRDEYEPLCCPFAQLRSWPKSAGHCRLHKTLGLSHAKQKRGFYSTKSQQPERTGEGVARICN